MGGGGSALQIKHRRLLRSAGRWDDARVEPHAADATVELDQALHAQFEEFLDEYRAAINACLDGLSEEQARRSVVASKTTLLGLVKHATFVEQVWFDQAVTCRTRADLGIPETADDSFDLDDGDTITSVQEAHRQACASSRATMASLALDDLVHGNRRGPLAVRWVYLHVLGELAQHCGHADILREQILTP